MRNLRDLFLLASATALAACATQTLSPDKAPEYLTARDPTPFYLKSPRPGSEPEELLKAETRVKVLRQATSYSLVLLEDSRQGYVANAYITPTPPGSQMRPFGSSESDRQSRRKRRASASPTPEPAQSPEAAPADSSAPPADTTGSPDFQAPPVDVPSPTPTPEAPLEKPKFRL
jgi:hypothetical protein